MIKLFDTERLNDRFRNEISSAVNDTIKDKLFRGKAVRKFEEKFAEYVQADDCAVVSSGSDALLAVALASGLRPGDEVLCTSYSFLATASMFNFIGVKLKFIDIKFETYSHHGNDTHMCIDVDELERVVTPNTRAIIWTDFAGMTPPISRILRIKDKYPHIILIEDAAQATGTTYLDHKLGQLADFTVHSFGHWKNLGALGGGGAVTGKNMDQIREIRNHGRPENGRGGRNRQGFNMEMHTLQAAILLAKLKKHDYIIDLKREHADHYRDFIINKCDPYINPPEIPEWCEPSWYMFNIRVPYRPALSHGNANKIVQDFLGNAGIETKINYMYTLPEQFGEPATGRAAVATKQLLGIPCHPFLDKKERDLVCEELQKVSESIQ